MAKRATTTDSKTVLLIWSVLCVPLLVYCGGKSDHDESSGATGSNGGSAGYVTRGGGTGGSMSGGVGGHTGSCSPGSCYPPCSNYPACLPAGGTGGQGGYGMGAGGFGGSGVGAGGFGGSGVGAGGFGGSGVGAGGFGGVSSGYCLGPACVPGCARYPGCLAGGGGIGGHTSGCGMDPCGPGCGLTCAGTAGEGGDMGLGGDEAGPDGAGNGGDSASSRLAGTGGANRFFPEPAEHRACYALPGYQDDPCLPPDDGILPWLSPTTDCDARVSDGPFLTSDAGGRQCCYTVTCAP
jgi:hypothetical protein